MSKLRPIKLDVAAGRSSSDWGWLQGDPRIAVLTAEEIAELREFAAKVHVERERLKAEQLLYATGEKRQGPAEGSVEWWRWHFAGQALSGLLASESQEDGTYTAEGCAKRARSMADALIAELQKEER